MSKMQRVTEFLRNLPILPIVAAVVITGFSVLAISQHRIITDLREDVSVKDAQLGAFQVSFDALTGAVNAQSAANDERWIAIENSLNTQAEAQAEGRAANAELASMIQAERDRDEALDLCLAMPLPADVLARLRER